MKLAPHNVATPGVCGGRPRVDGTRISVALVVEMSEAGASAAEIAGDHGLAVAQVEAALSYAEAVEPTAAPPDA